MKYLFLVLVILVGLAWYLQSSYSKIYQFIAKQSTQSPFTEKRYLLIGDGQQTIKYIALGDDFTAGIGNSDITKTYPYQIAKKLALNANSLTFINLANPGATVKEVLEMQIPQAILEKPNVITLQVGINDVHNLENPSKYRDIYEQILNKLAGSGARVVIINTPFVGSPRLMNFPFNIFFELRTRQLNGEVEGINRQQGFEYFNLHAKTFEALTISEDLYSPDLIHPNDKEYVYWGKLISEGISF